MGKYAGPSFALMLVDGFNLIASLYGNASMSTESITEQTNPFGVGSESHSPINIEKGTLVAGDGFFDATTDALHSAIGKVTGVSRIICAAFLGNTIGKRFYGWSGVFDLKYDMIDAKEGLTKANVTYQIAASEDEGVIVQDLIPLTANWDTKTGGAGSEHAPVDFTLDPMNRQMDIASNTLANPTVVTMATQHSAAILHGLITGDKVLFSSSNSTPSLNGVQTVTVTSPTTFTVPVNVTIAGTVGKFVRVQTDAGGDGYLQVTAYSGFTNVVCKIMHSPDDTTYATLVTFTTVTAAPAKERITVNGFVDRFFSSNGVVTGGGSITPFMGFSRN